MPDLPDLVRALLDPSAYPERSSRIDLAQTQMSFLFMGNEYVYKVKKPVNLGYLDYTTLEKRAFFCQREVELNRRLCLDVYLGVVPITKRGQGFQVGGSGQAVEYAVKMRRLPGERMMDRLLNEGKVSCQMVERLAARLVDFHRRAEGSPDIGRFGGLDTIKQNTGENFSQTDKYLGRTISEARYRCIKAYTEEFISRNAPLFERRVAGGRIRDCHGDLHAAHICFQDSICVYDCIEFNDRFRYCDVASEIAFLAMDLDHYGRGDLSRAFVKAYIRFSGDRELEQLLGFYKCYRAYVRGKVEGFKLDDPYISSEEKGLTLARANSYFDLAFAYTRSRPALFITAGLVGTGKSTLAAALARRTGLVVISSDVTRKNLARIPAAERRYEGFGQGIYSPEFTRRTYDEIFACARNLLSEGVSVLLDASFSKASDRRRAQDLAERQGASFYILECTASEAVVKQRLEERVKQGSVSDGRWEIFESQKQHFEPIADREGHLLIDTSGDIDRTVCTILEHIT